MRNIRQYLVYSLYFTIKQTFCFLLSEQKPHLLSIPISVLPGKAGGQVIFRPWSHSPPPRLPVSMFPVHTSSQLTCTWATYTQKSRPVMEFTEACDHCLYYLFLQLLSIMLLKPETDQKNLAKLECRIVPVSKPHYLHQLQLGFFFFLSITLYKCCVSLPQQSESPCC